VLEDILKIEQQIDDFSYPKPLLKVIELGLIDYDRWYLMPLRQILASDWLNRG